MKVRVNEDLEKHITFIGKMFSVERYNDKEFWIRERKLISLEHGVYSLVFFLHFMLCETLWHVTE